MKLIIITAYLEQFPASQISGLEAVHQASVKF